MTSDMITSPEHDYICSYERGINALMANPGDKDIQHNIVLSLARAGALDFAVSEYARYGLDRVQDHEDIMALAGRLSKDLYLRSTGEEASEHAKDSAQKYDAAFQGTQGYYSGINAATMALMADMPPETVSVRARAIIDILPAHENLAPTDHYFIEATRAESLLLSGDTRNAKTCLKDAIAFDPLNYTAHATTLKQFKMILNKRGEDLDWLLDFSPPRPIHYAGHINLALADADYEKLSSSITDYIQKNDIGFGFGALAAGSDIIIAEALLAEGAELHVVLPCGADIFLNESVQPFGLDWVTRHRACLKQASSTTIIAKHAPWPDARMNRFSGQYAMGQAVLRGQDFSVAAAQLLLWDGRAGASYTALHAEDWSKTERNQIVIPVKTNEAGKAASSKITGSFPFILKRSDEDAISQFETVSETITAAITAYASSKNVQIALHVDVPNEASDIVLGEILDHGTPQSILMSEAFASLLAHFENGRFNVNFAGLIQLNGTDPLRCYAVTVQQ